jgi:O-antigen ligase
LQTEINQSLIAKREKGALLVALAICLVPFNALPYLQNVLGEMSNEGAFYPLAIAMIIWSLGAIRVFKIKVPLHRSFVLLSLFFVWIIFSAAVNSPEIAVASTKGRGGIEKLLLQIVLVFFCMLATLVVYRCMMRVPRSLAHYRRYVSISFLICGLYSVIEIAYLSGSGIAEAILANINHYIQPERLPLYPGRLRSVSGEASWFAMYCSMVLPWLLSYLFSESRRRWRYFIWFAYFILLVVLTKSRTAYVITTIQFGLFCFGVMVSAGPQKTHRWRVVTIFLALVLVFGLTLVNLNSSGKSLIDVFASLASKKNMSNIARFGAQFAGYKMALDHPVFGVGLGQYGFHVADYIPSWALVSDEIRIWISPTEGTSWAPVHNIYARIASEAGFVGLLLWISMWGSVLLGCIRKYRSNTVASRQPDYVGLALVVSIVGVLLSGFNADSFRFFGYWLSLGAAWAYMSQTNSQNFETQAG